MCPRGERPVTSPGTPARWHHAPRTVAADSSTAHRALAARLAAAGFVAADDEAGELLERAGGDERVLEQLVERRLTGEPLAWIVGATTFCALRIRVEPGVYVP